VRDGTEFARRDALRGRAVCCACGGRSPTNQVGQRGWEANRENRCSVSSMTPPLQRASLGVRSALRRPEGPEEANAVRDSLVCPQRHAKGLLKPLLAASLGQVLPLTPSSAVEPPTPPWVHDCRADAAIADATTGQGGMAGRASQRRVFAVDYSPISPTARGRHGVIVHSILRRLPTA
jgi:hypothetical protein